MSNLSTEHHYDLILIGSGMGALTVASLMAQLRHKKVLLLERHFKAGGFTHDFKRQQFHWDVGLHYIGSMGEDNDTRAMMDLVTGGNVQWQRLPEPMDVALFPGFRFPLYGDRDRYEAALIDRFPQEAKAIGHYFRDLQATFEQGYPAHTMKQCRAFPMPLLGTLTGLLSRSWVHWTVKDYLDRRFHNPELKAILTAQWGDVGLPPGLCAFPIFATVMNHYIGGGYYPVGGAGTIADSVQQIVEERGGKFLLNRAVTEILIENDQAVGVRVQKVNAQTETIEEYFAPTIVSDAGAATTYLNLIPSDYPIPFRESLRRFVERNEPTTDVSVYLGLSQDPRSLGVRGENYWIYDTLDHDDTYRRRGEWVQELAPIQAYVAFLSLRDPQATSHTAEILAWTDYNIFARWQNQPWLHRDEEYQVLKERLTDTLINFVDRHIPGFANIVEYKELSTPITNEHFTGHHHGAIYGLPAVTERFRQENLDWTRPTTPVPGLYLTGVDVHCLGVVGALMSASFSLCDLPQGIFQPELAAVAKARKKPESVGSKSYAT
jgi:all-trans-retinol 13,14-reductase